MKNGTVVGGGGGNGISPYPLPPKKRWKGLVMAVLGLVILSMLVPLVFLLGLHSGFHSAGSMPDNRDSNPSVLGVYTHHFSSDTRNQSKQEPKHVDELIERLVPLTKRISNSDGVLVNKTVARSSDQRLQTTKGLPGRNDGNATANTNKPKVNSPVNVVTHSKAVGESDVACEIRYGSYCLWRSEYKEDLKDFMVKRMKDLLFVARAYFPSIAKMPAHDKLSRELRHNIQEFEHIMSYTTSDVDLPHPLGNTVPRMEAAIAKAKSLLVDCTNVDKKFRQLVDLTEDEASFHMKQSAFLYQLAVQTTPKSLHCLSMRLTVEYFHASLPDVDDSEAQKYVDPTLYHVVIFSNNILASSVAVNSTVFHSTESKKLVFHVVTDRQNYFAMKLWFLRNTFRKATVQVLNIEEGRERDMSSHLSLPEEFRVSYQSLKMPAEYLSLFSYSHYVLPDIFNNLNKIVVLDDDIVVQQDLSALWNINLEGKVNGAVEHCAVKLGELSSYLGGNLLSQNSCAWMSGLNVLDLRRWRELDVTANFRKLVQELNGKGQSAEGVASRASLLVFQDLVYPLDGSFVLSGLGHYYGINREAVGTSAVLHYNGNMKPWLELGVPQYKTFWTRYLVREDQYLSECNVNP